MRKRVEKRGALSWLVALCVVTALPSWSVQIRPVL